MTTPDYLLTTGIVWVLLVVNALYPVRHWAPLVVPSFFAAWLPVEAPLHVGAVLLSAITALALADGVQGWAGWLGLALAVMALGGLWFLHVQGRRSAAVVEAALRAQLPGSGGGEARLSQSILRMLLLFRFRDPAVEVLRDIPYCPDGHPRHGLDIYRRRGVTRGAPVLLQIHGGGWMIGHKAQQAQPSLYSMAAQGWLCVSINYRLSPSARWPDHLVDVKRALVWVKQAIAGYGGDPATVVVTGGSAGGHLAAMAALTAGRPEFQPGFEQADTSVQGAAICYGVYDFTDQSLWCYRGWRWYLRRYVLPPPVDDLQRLLGNASPLAWVDEQAPPFMVLHGRNDSLICCGQARGFVQALRDISRQAIVYVELPYAQHAFDLFHSPRCQAVVCGIHRFVESLRPRA